MVGSVMRETSLNTYAPVTAVLGPTNTGKTHLAVERMLGHKSGMIGLPLRLLAREVFDRVVAEKGAQCVALITGEEKIIPPNAAYYVCTVEAMPLDIEVSFLAVDEIQLAQDPERGHVFTDRLLHARGQEETMFLGAETMRPLLKQLLVKPTFVTRPRFSDLSYAGPKKLSRLPRRTAIVAFSVDAVYAIAEFVRRQRGGAAVVMGALSPRTRNAQVALYQSGDVDFLVATDAIGMGLNMDVDHVAFASLAKFDGQSMRPLNAAETAQIAGRAGRYLQDGTFGTTAECAAMDAELVEQIETHRFDPVRALHWRSTNLDFSSLSQLIDCLESPSIVRGLIRTRPATDLNALKALAGAPKIMDMAAAPAAIRRLWDVCQIPDFVKVMTEEHIRLLTAIYLQLMGDHEQISSDWLAAQVRPLDRTDGDLDTLSNRLAHMRTWSFVANRSGWVREADHWRSETRAIENRLSDALHERLTQRFVDRRTSVLMKRLADDEISSADITQEGEVLVEGEYVGRLLGLGFAADPRAKGVHGKALRAAALKALAPEIEQRARDLAGSDDLAITLTDLGKLWWRGAAIARLTPGAHWLEPQISLLQTDDISSDLERQIMARLQSWVTDHIKAHAAPLAELRAAVEDTSQGGLKGLPRGIGFQLVENFGLLDRREVAAQIRILEPPDRAALRRLGVRFGEFSIFMPKALKPAATQCIVLLRRVAEEDPLAGAHLPPAPGLCSVPRDDTAPRGFYAACGYLQCGARAVRVDMLERLALLIRQTLDPLVQKPAEHKIKEKETETKDTGEKVTEAPEQKPSLEKPPEKNAGKRTFTITPDMMSLVGCSGAEFESVLQALNFCKEIRKGEDDTPIEEWRRKPYRRARPETRGKRPPRSEKPAHAKSAKPKKPRGPAGKKPPSRREKPMDPDSPFAVLRALTRPHKAP